MLINFSEKDEKHTKKGQSVGRKKQAKCRGKKVLFSIIYLRNGAGCGGVEFKLYEKEIISVIAPKLACLSLELLLDKPKTAPSPAITLPGLARRDPAVPGGRIPGFPQPLGLCGAFA